MAAPVRRLPLIVPPFVLVALIALAVAGGWTTGLDRAIMQAVAPPASLLPLVRSISRLGDTATRFAIGGGALLLLLLRGRWRDALSLVVLVAGGAALNSLVKLAVARPRPDLLPLLDHVTGSSFPSGHSAGAVTTYVALALVVGGRRGRWLVPAILLAGLIGLSRVALAVHWPSDVVAGWCLGIGWLLPWHHAAPAPALGVSPRQGRG